MLKLSLLEFFFRAIPEAFLLIFAIYAFSKTAINIKKYLISSILLVILAYSIRFLPIQFGVHTILSFVVMIVLIVNINKINIIKTIQSSIIVIILEFICEAINMIIIQNIFKMDLNYVFNNPTLKILYGIPSLMIFACVTIPYYLRALKRKELMDIFNGEIS